MAKQSFIDRKLEEIGQAVALFNVEQTAVMRGYDSVTEEVEEFVEEKNERMRNEATERLLAKLRK